MSNVPNTTTFSLQDVYDSVHSHAVSTSGNLNSCFTNAVGSYFDVNYNTVSYAPANSQKRFRNYTPVTSTPATISMAATLLNNPAAGVYNYTLVITIVATVAQSGSFSFYLDFLNGFVPAGQSEARGANISKIPELPTTVYGEGTVRTINTSWTAGTSTITYNLQYLNDNWDYPRPSSSFRLRLFAGTNTVLSVPNSTVTNGTTFVTSVLGVTTTFITVTAAIGGRTESGEMIGYFYSRQNIFPSSYTASGGYKDVFIQETFSTGGANTNRNFIQTDYSGSGPVNNYMSGSKSDGNVTVSTLYTVTNFEQAWYNRYTLLNTSGTSSLYSYTFEPYKYCSFTTQTYSQTINSYVPGAHVLGLYQFSGNNDYFPVDLNVIPGTNSLTDGETFQYKYLVHCPNGGYINFYKSGSSELRYDGQEFLTTNYYQNNSTFLFAVLNTTDARGRITIGPTTNSRDGRIVIFNEPSQFVEIVPMTSNVTVTSHYPYKFGYYGIIDTTTIWTSISKSSYNGGYNLSCNGGSNGTITITNIGGGSGSGYQVKLNSDGTYVNYTINLTYSNLIATSYVVYARDGVGNVTTFPITLTSPPAQISSISGQTNPTCGFNNGSFMVSSVGGVFPKTYYVYRDETSPYEITGGTLYTTLSNVSNTGLLLVSNLPPGGYYMTSIDANGCSSTSGVVLLPVPC